MTDNNEHARIVSSELSDAHHVIRCLGGIRPTASLLGVAASTVQGWKERGVIPENRREAVLRVAEQSGIDLVGDKTRTTRAGAASGRGEGVAPQPKNEEILPTKTSVAGRSRTGGSSSGVARLTLLLVVVALIAVVTQPLWVAELFPDEILYNKPFAASSSEESIAGRIDALEEHQNTLSSGAMTTLTNIDLTQLINRIKALEEVSLLDSTGKGIATELSALSNRMVVLEKVKTDAVPEYSVGSLRSQMTELTSEVMTLNERLTLLEGVLGGDSYYSSALTLAIGQLEVTINTGGPFTRALERLQELGRGDHIVDDSVRLLATWSEDGIPTVAELHRRFKSVFWELEQTSGSVSPDEGLWNKIRDQIIGLVKVSRIGEVEDLSVGARSEQAVKNGDLELAVAALEETATTNSDTVRAWVRQAKARLAAEVALNTLNTHALEALVTVGAKIR